MTENMIEKFILNLQMAGKLSQNVVKQLILDYYKEDKCLNNSS